MGEVYRAKDTKLNRDVALKVLPEAFTADPDRLGRFKREAQVLASLNHPNIAAIYGFEESAGIRALVLELVEGPTLADRIAHGPIPIDEALPVAKQIAEALEAAHEHGIIHRDLKPANVKVRSDGAVKVLDFGLAKALEPSASTVTKMTTSPTITSPAMTQMGVILGTAAYMSPEQARGKPVDKRADIWAFGSVLFEMLTGRPAFGGETVTDTLASVVKEEPRWTDLATDTPPGIRKLIARSLLKDPLRRLQAIGEARIAIEEAAREPSIDQPPICPRVSRRAERIGWIAALVVISAIALATVPRALRPVRPVLTFPETYVEITTPRTTDPGSLSISPDGRKLVFAASAEGRSQL
jgi:eukaryotic-like serine/threonine-protein kinase